MIRHSTWLLFAVPPAALAAERLLLDSATGAFWGVLGAVQALCLLGHAAASLSTWAAWRDEGTVAEVRARRFHLAQGVAVSLLAGNATYYGGVYVGMYGIAESLIGASLAAWGGDRFLGPVLERVVEMLRTALGGAARGASRGNNDGG